MSEPSTWSFPGPICANIAEEGTNCKNNANLTCNRCHLVKYCNATCQKANWPLHKLDCRSPLTRTSWAPIWETEKRERASQPEAATDDSKAQTPKYLFGNMPAIDVLRNTNRAVDENGDLDLCFAASGDLRNVVETIVNIPETFTKNVRVLINDLDDVVAIRNLMLLLVALEAEKTVAPTIMLHLWYSINVPAEILSILGTIISQLPEKTSMDAGQQEFIQMDWEAGTRKQSIRTASHLLGSLTDLITTPRDVVVCKKSRDAKLKSQYGLDYRETEIFPANRFQRVSSIRFLQTGLVLPLSTPVTAFTEPNPTIFSPDGTYNLNISSDPYHGWPTAQIKAHASTLTLPLHDCYGNLHSFLLSHFTTFIARLQALNFSFIITNEDCKNLPSHLSNPTQNLPHLFDMIEISNMSDMRYLNIEIFSIFPDLLKPTVTSTTQPPFLPTIIALYQTFLSETLKYISPQPAPDRELLLTKIVDLFGIGFEDLHEGTAWYSLVFHAMHVLYPKEELWAWYRGKVEMEALEESSGVRVRGENMVTDVWPMMVLAEGEGVGKGQVTREGVLEMLAEGSMGWERYVEWVRV